jgi:nitrogen regulatory protein PII
MKLLRAVIPRIDAERYTDLAKEYNCACDMTECFRSVPGQKPGTKVYRGKAYAVTLPPAYTVYIHVRDEVAEAFTDRIRKLAESLSLPSDSIGFIPYEPVV